MSLDVCICPECKTELEINGLYGLGLKCSECNCRIDVFRDSDLILETKFGTIVVSLPE